MNTESVPSAAQEQHGSTSEPTMAPRPGRYRVDTAGSAITFRTRHLFGLAPVRGSVAIRSGSVEVADPLSASRAAADVDAVSFSTGNQQRDSRVRSARFLDAKRFPAITFRSDQIAADGRTVTGTLKVGETARPVSLSVTPVSIAAEAFTVRAQVRLDRTEFGVTASPGLAGRFLQLTVEVRCVRA